MPNLRVNPPFRLLYDLRWMELGMAGGVEQASYELVAAVARLDRKNRYRLLAPRRACWEWEFPARFDVARIYSDAGEAPGERFHAYVGERLAHGAAASSRFPDLAFDLVHSTCSYIHPEVIHFPGVVTVQDLQHLHYPDFFTREDREARERLYRESVARARHVICGSEFTRRDVIARYGVEPERTTTIWNIPSSTAWREVAPARRRRLLAGMGVAGRFFLYPAHSWPHKNHAALVEAVAAIDDRLPRDVRVVLTGRAFSPDHPAARMIRSRALDSRIVHLGYRSPLEIRALLQECLALVFPSLFEGFGMPVAEAIIAGKPVACSSVTSLPEIAGEAAVMFDPRDPAAIGARMLELASNAELRESLAAAARGRRAVFSASKVALETLAVYERVFASVAKSA